MRALAIVAFAGAAVLGRRPLSGNRLLVRLGAGLFLLGVSAFFRWRAAKRD
jgi:hypothetical protein